MKGKHDFHRQRYHVYFKCWNAEMPSNIKLEQASLPSGPWHQIVAPLYTSTLNFKLLLLPASSPKL